VGSYLGYFIAGYVGYMTRVFVDSHFVHSQITVFRMAFEHAYRLVDVYALYLWKEKFLTESTGQLHESLTF